MVSFGVILGLLAALSWGVSDYFAKIAATREKKFLPVHFDTLASLLLITGINYFFPSEGYGAFTLIPGIAVVSFFMATGWWLFMFSLQDAKVSIQGPLSASYGLITLVFGIVFLQESPSLAQIMGVILIVLGAAAISYRKNNFKLDRNALLASAASLCWGLGFIFIAPFAKTLPPAVAIQSHFFFSFLFSLALVLIFRRKLLPSRLISLYPPALVGIFAIAGNFAYYTGASFYFTSLLAPLSSIYPVFTIILAYIFLHERLKPLQLKAVMAILIGIVLISA